MSSGMYGPLLLLLIAAVSSSPVFSNSTLASCTSNADCPSDHSCVNRLCEDLCQGLCGDNTQCTSTDLGPSCSCLPGYHGYPFTGCTEIETHECTSDSDCPKDRSCLNYKCEDPCFGACGMNTGCKAANHKPVCACLTGFYLNSTGCLPIATPQCKTNKQCAEDEACIEEMCTDPCVGVCGNNTVCKVTNHYPSCACMPGYGGDPFVQCHPFCISPELEFKSSIEFKKKIKEKGTKKYVAVEQPATINEALKECRKRNMELATIENEEESRMINLITKGDKVYYTSGYLRDDSSGWDFSWISTGEDVTYTNWRKGEPYGNMETHKCIKLENGRWYAGQCDNAMQFICQYYTL